MVLKNSILSTQSHSWYCWPRPGKKLEGYKNIMQQREELWFLNLCVSLDGVWWIFFFPLHLGILLKLLIFAQMTYAEVQRILTSKIFCKKSTSSFPTPYNPGRNILAIYSVLVQVLFTKSKTGLKMCYSKLCLRVVSQITKNVGLGKY